MERNRHVDQEATGLTNLLRRKSILVLFAFLGIVQLQTNSSLIAQAPKKKTSVKPIVSKTKTSPIPYLASEFDGSVQNFNLEKGFAGHDPREVSRLLKGIWTKKSEFESTKEYETRMYSLARTKLFGSLHLNSTFAFVIPPTTALSETSSTANYDADTRVLKVVVRADFGTLYTDAAIFGLESNGDLQAFPVATIGPTNLKTYIGRSGLGIRRKVSVGEYERTSIVFANCRKPRSGSLDVGIATQSGTVSLPLSPTDAVDLKYNLGILVVGNMLPPYAAFKRSLWASPKFDSPIEIWVNENVIFMDIKELWLYSSSSGRVFAKVPECTMTPAEPSYLLSYNFLF